MSKFKIASLFLMFTLGAVKCPAQSEDVVFDRPMTNIKDWKVDRIKTPKAAMSIDPSRTLNGQPRLTVSYEFKAKQRSYFCLQLKEIKGVKNIDKITYSMYEDNSHNIHVFYCIDAEGEIFTARKRGANSEGWTPYSIAFSSLKHYPASGYKKGNHKLDYPLKTIGFRVTNYSVWGKSKLKGKLSFADLKLYSKSSVSTELKNIKSPRRNKIITALKNDKISLSGKLNEWKTGHKTILDSKHCTVLEGKSTGYSADLYANYDNRSLYIAVVVRDPEIYGEYNNNDIWKNDGIEVWLDIKNNSLLAMNQPDDFQLLLSATSGKGKPGIWVARNKKPAYLIAETKSTVTKIPGGYMLEAAIPLTALTGLPPKVDGHIAGINVSLCNAGKNDYSRLIWSKSANRRAHCPAEFGLLTFGEVNQAQLDKVYQARKQLREGFIHNKNSKAKYAGAPAILKVEAPETARKYKKYEINVDLLAEYKNPYDFDDINLSAEFTSPSGKKQKVDGFYFQQHRFFLSNKSEEIVPHGPPIWKIRFAPMETGNYNVAISVRDSKGRKAVFKPVKFHASESGSDGFLRVSGKDPCYLVFDTGKPFYGSGFAAHFWHKMFTMAFCKQYITELAYFGANYTSINMENVQNCGFKLETGKLGRYSQESGTRLDFALKIAEDRGVYIIPCLNQTSLALFKRWKNNMYNKKHGGPCTSPVEYFTNPEALRLIKNRTRYTMARWGYSTAILGWEIFNEVNYTEGFKKDKEIVRKFHRQVSDWIREFDCGNHLITTSFGSNNLCEDPQVWRQKNIDFTITHCYSRDMAQSIYERQSSKLLYHKPNIGGEAGLPASDCSVADLKDPDGISVHNIIWGSAMAKCAGNVLCWWPFRLIQPMDLGRLFVPFVNYSSDINWPEQNFKRMLLTAKACSGKSGMADYSVPFALNWGPYTSLVYTIKPDGVWGKLDPSKVKVTYIADADLNVKLPAVSGIIFGRANPDWHKTMSLKLFSAKKTSALLRLKSVAKSGADLTVTNNGKAIKKLSVKDTDNANNPYADELDITVSIPLEKGENTIELSNNGPGWLAIQDMVIKNYVSAGNMDNVRCFALIGDTRSLLWLQNAKSTWYLNSIGTKLDAIGNINVEIPVRKNGKFKVEWWDTWNSKIVKTETVTAKNGKVKVLPPRFMRDIAAKITMIK